MIRDTQRAAWDDIQGRLPITRAQVLEVIKTSGDFGMTIQGVADTLKWPVNCVSGRVTELTNLGFIKDSGRRGVNPSGKKAVLWVMV